MRRVWCSYRHSHRGARCSSRWKLITQIDRPGVDILVQFAEHDAGILPSGAQIVDIVVDRFVEHIAEAALIGRVALGVRIGPTNIEAQIDELALAEQLRDDNLPLDPIGYRIHSSLAVAKAFAVKT